MFTKDAQTYLAPSVLLRLRTLSMLMIVWFHIPNAFMTPYRHLFYISVCMPYFLLSGYGIGMKEQTTSPKSQQGWWGFLYRRIRKFYVPLIIFSALIFVARTIFTDPPPSIVNYLRGLALGKTEGLLDAYWFVLSLLMMQLLYYIMAQFIKHVPLRVALFFLFPTVMLFIPLPDVWQLIPACFLFPYFGAGVAIAQRSWRVILVWLITAALYFALAMAVWPSEYYIHLWRNIIAIGYSALLWIVAWGSLKVILIHRIEQQLSAAALVLLAVQNDSIELIRILLAKATNQESFLATSQWLHPLVMIIVYIIGMALYYFIKSYVPWILAQKQSR